ncbi:ParB/RepB/Spo0J family partition protein [Thalassoroseus pseudoceratinae]|uniref:ParB/RepB/Spo0J family partition protein n=1 Tax=Thalassoroseus pseudoceratinae TaxID=2713176 RepID=UPI001F112222|nr:ParB/RepB/Spo0J family partition protein [Thalassoroseus pseudoceratinae]
MRRRLGRGLNALLGGNEQESQTLGHLVGDGGPIEPSDPIEKISVRSVPVGQIERNPYQPRKEFDKETLNELAESLITHGVLQPLIVRPSNGKFQLIAGERRWLAATEAGIETVPCRVMELEDKAVCEVAIVENVQRKDLSDLEKAEAFQGYLDQFGGTAADLAKQLGMNRSTVSNFIRLLSLAEPVKKALNSGKISNGHARAMLSLDAEAQAEVCTQVQRESLTVRKTEEAVKELLGRTTPTEENTNPNTDADETPDTVPFSTLANEAASSENENTSEESNGSDEPSEENEGKTNHILSLESQLRETLGAKVDIRVTGKDEGKITVHFGSNEEFERLVRALRSAGVDAHKEAA